MTQSIVFVGRDGILSVAAIRLGSSHQLVRFDHDGLGSSGHLRGCGTRRTHSPSCLGTGYCPTMAVDLLPGVTMICAHHLRQDRAGSFDPSTKDSASPAYMTRGSGR